MRIFDRQWLALFTFVLAFNSSVSMADDEVRLRFDQGTGLLSILGTEGSDTIVVTSSAVDREVEVVGNGCLAVFFKESACC